MTLSRRWHFRLWMISSLWMLAESGCAPVVRRAQVARRFQTIHGCAGAKVQRTGVHGYQASGCGRVAHFTCIDTSGSDGLFRAVGTTCIQEHSERTARAPSRYRGPVGIRVYESAGRTVVRTAFAVPGGRVHLIAAPGTDPDHAHLAWLSRADRASPAACEPVLVVDGLELPVEVRSRSVREGSTQTEWKLPLSVLASIAVADAAAIESCGQHIVIGFVGRETAGRFVERVRILSEREQQLASTLPAQTAP